MKTTYISKDKGGSIIGEKPLAYGVERLIKHTDGKHYWVRHYRSGYEMRETSWILNENGLAILRSDTRNLLHAQGAL